MSIRLVWFAFIAVGLMKNFSVVVLIAGLLLCGCNSGREGEVAKRRTSIGQLAKSYQAYADEKASAPSGAEELASFMEANGGEDKVIVVAVKRLREGDIMLFWNGDLSDQAMKAKCVLAFEAVCARGGGYVAMGDGEVKLMSPKQFAGIKEIPQLSASE